MTYTLSIPARDMPAVILGLDMLIEAERAAMNDGRHIGKPGLLEATKDLRDSLIAQRDAQDRRGR